MILLKKGFGRHKPLFKQAQERGIEGRLFILTQNKLRSLAFKLADRNGLVKHFNNEWKTLVKVGYTVFIEYIFDIRLRTPERASSIIGTNFNKIAVGKLLFLLWEILENIIYYEIAFTMWMKLV